MLCTKATRSGRSFCVRCSLFFPDPSNGGKATRFRILVKVTDIDSQRMVVQVRGGSPAARAPESRWSASQSIALVSGAQIGLKFTRTAGPGREAKAAGLT